MKTSKQKIKRKIMIQDFKGKEIFNIENELGVCLTTSDWANILYNRNEIYKRFDIMLKEIDEEYRTTLINFGKYKVVMFTMAKIMEMQQDERNKITLYLVNNLNVY